MRINIYTAINGVGLEMDSRLLSEMLQGHKINILDWKRKQRGTNCDLSIHLEIPRYDCLRLAKRNILIPNPEWFEERWKSGLNGFNEIWCKTLDCQRIFSQLHKNAIHSGFISQDMYMGDVKRSKLLIHVAGKSKSKGTKWICEAYKKYPELPKCYLVSSDNWECSNSLIRCERLPFDHLKILMNSALIHLCPSSYEGWGHYIHEALSTGANVITTDHPPMNEFCKGIPISGIEKMGLADIGNVSADSVADEINRIYSMSISELKELGAKNRIDFLDRNERFRKFVNQRINN